MKKILWLPSWYPNKNFPYDGDFIQRHAKAVALHCPIQIIFVVKDVKGRRNSVSIEHTTIGNLHETIAYFTPLRTGFRPFDRLISIVRFIVISRKLVTDFIKKEGLPPVVHVHVAMWSGNIALWVKKKFKIPYIVTEHWTGYDIQSKDNFYNRDVFFRRNVRNVITGASLLLPVSNHLGKLISSSFGNIPYRVIPNAVDTSCFNLSEILPPVYQFIHVSMMNYQKNPEGILRCFARLVLIRKDVALMMVGPAGNDLKELSQRLNISSYVTWMGEIAYTQVALELKQASCLVMFSRYENLPCAVLEALCCGLPVIATRTGGIPEILDNSNSILVETEEEEELLQAMKTMAEVSGKYDRSLISAAACRQFNYNFVGGLINKVYEEEGDIG